MYFHRVRTCILSYFLITFLSICITRMSSKIQSVEKYIELFTYEFSKMKIFVLDIKEFFEKCDGEVRGWREQ